MIDVIQWRMSIGVWCHVSQTVLTGAKNVNTCLNELTTLGSIWNLTHSLVLSFFLLLILSGDVELNPGPKTGTYLCLAYTFPKLIA